uniref:TRUD domain-containing protein n=1 Tax=Arion vulgaris TaxID=1028688 RepID=A0A0B7AA66_9EUPU
METITDDSNSTVTMNTLETVLDESKLIVTVNTLDTVYEVKNQDTICDESKCSEITKTDEIAAGESNCSAVMDSVVKADKSMSPVEEAIISGSNCAISSTSKRVAAESHEPECKKAKLESNNPVKDSLSVLSQSDFSLKEEDGKSTKSCDDAVIRRNQADSSEKQSPLTETQAGITEYLGSHKGFSAVIKQRYSDFIVNEIDMLGNVVQLTQMELSECLDKSNTECEQEGEITSDIISKEDIAKLENLIKSGDKNTIVNIIAPQDKDARTKIHLAIKKKYPQAETKTADVDGQKMIQVMWKTGKSRDRNKDDWPESKKDYKYVKFVLYKENKDTMDAIGLISKNLKVKESLFQYAGTKDKRAKTSQEITSYKIHPKKLSFMNKVLWNMGLGNFQYVKEPLKLGQLSGNQFTIVLRNVQESLETVNSAITSLKTQGFINYFGMQRFGTTLVPTHRVGCSLLHGDWEKAVDLILMPRDDNPSKDAFQKVWMETKDPEATLKVTPPYCGLERNLLEALKKKMKPFNALEKISRNTRLLYIHSYQAFVWNQMVSKRLKVFGFQPIVGDLVLKDGSDSSGWFWTVVY